jgi:hypothetical protein
MPLIGWTTLYEARGVCISRHDLDNFTTVEELGETKIEGYRSPVAAEILRLAARLREAEELLLGCEWGHTDYPGTCSHCDNEYLAGHGPGCLLAAFLTEQSAAPPEGGPQDPPSHPASASRPPLPGDDRRG